MSGEEKCPLHTVHEQGHGDVDADVDAVGGLLQRIVSPVHESIEPALLLLGRVLVLVSLNLLANP